MRLLIGKCGPIDSVAMELGDLTILVGPQATGKSIALQMLKLAEEYPAIKRTMVDYAFILHVTARISSPITSAKAWLRSGLKRRRY
jgi:hypothetical protein